MEEVEIEHRLTEVEQRANNNSTRIAKLEKVTDAIYEMSSTMAHLVEQVKTTNDKVQELNDKVDSIEQEPANDYKALKKTVLTSILSTLLGAIIGALLSLIIR